MTRVSEALGLPIKTPMMPPLTSTRTTLFFIMLISKACRHPARCVSRNTRPTISLTARSSKNKHTGIGDSPHHSATGQVATPSFPKRSCRRTHVPIVRIARFRASFQSLSPLAAGVPSQKSPLHTAPVRKLRDQAPSPLASAAPRCSLSQTEGAHAQFNTSTSRSPHNLRPRPGPSRHGPLPRARPYRNGHTQHPCPGPARHPPHPRPNQPQQSPRPRGPRVVCRSSARFPSFPSLSTSPGWCAGPQHSSLPSLLSLPVSRSPHLTPTAARATPSSRAGSP